MDSSTARAACITMKLVALCSRATSRTRCCNSRRPVHRHPGAAVIGHRRIGPIGGQLQTLGHPGQRLLPVGQLRGDRAVAVVQITQLRALPQRVIDILHRQRRPARGLPRTPAGIGHTQITHQRGHRPAVGGDMVHHGHQHMLVIGDAEKLLPATGSRPPGQTCDAPPRRWPPPAGSPASRWHQRPANRNRPARRGTTSCWGIPSGAANSVRRLSWRPTTSASAAPNASTSRRPPSRNATAML